MTLLSNKMQTVQCSAICCFANYCDDDIGRNGIGNDDIGHNGIGNDDIGHNGIGNDDNGNH